MTQRWSDQILLETGKVVTSNLPEGVIKRFENTKIQEADKMNTNRRIYPEQIWDSWLESDTTKDRLAKGGFVGELGHPFDDRLDVDLTKSSHIIRNVHKEGKDIRGDIDIINTPHGKIANTLIECGVILGLSSRSEGEVEKTFEDGNAGERVKTLNLETWDFVINPSVADAIPNELRESVSKTGHKRLLEAVQKLVNDTDPKVVKESNIIFGNLLKELNDKNSKSEVTMDKEKETIRENTSTNSVDVVALMEAATKIGEKMSNPELAKSLNEKVVTLSTENESLKKDNTELSKNLEAAKKFIKEAVNKIEGLKKANISRVRAGNGVNESSTKTIKVLNRKLTEAKVILAKAQKELRRFAESKKLLKEASVEISRLTRRSVEGEKLLKESLNEKRTDKLTEYISNAFKTVLKLSESDAEKYLPMFKGVKNIKEASERVNIIKGILSKNVTTAKTFTESRATRTLPTKSISAATRIKENVESNSRVSRLLEKTNINM